MSLCYLINKVLASVTLHFSENYINCVLNTTFQLYVKLIIVCAIYLSIHLNQRLMINFRNQISYLQHDIEYVESIKSFFTYVCVSIYVCAQNNVHSIVIPHRGVQDYLS